MKFVEPSSLADPDVAARRLVEIASTVEAVQDGRIYIELINGSFIKDGGTPDQYLAALASAVAHGWLLQHESGTYVKFTAAGAEDFDVDAGTGAGARLASGARPKSQQT